MILDTAKFWMYSKRIIINKSFKDEISDLRKPELAIVIFFYFPNMNEILIIITIPHKKILIMKAFLGNLL